MVKIASKHVVIVFAIWCTAVYVLFSIAVIGSGDPKMRAMLGMVSGLLMLWVILGGSTMYLLRDGAKAFVQKLPGDWRLKFILFCTIRQAHARVSARCFSGFLRGRWQHHDDDRQSGYFCLNISYRK